MGFGDFMSGLGNAYMNYTPTGKVLGAAFGPTPKAAPPPGVVTGNVPTDPSKLRPNPDGTLTDLSTGQTYNQTPDGYGGSQLMPVMNPNTAQQVGQASNQAQSFYGQVPGYDQREAGAYNREGNLADSLTNIALGHGPSVAGTQLAIGQEQAARSQLAQAAGSSGNGAALSRLAAMGNTAGLQAQTNQQQALARTNEQMGAYGALGNVTGHMVDQSQAAAGQKIGAGNFLTNQAMGGELAHEGQAVDVNKANVDAKNKDRDRWLNFGSSVASGGAKLG